MLLLLFLACEPTTLPPDPVEDCFDGVDNDGDDRVDCSDIDCFLDCLPETEEDCSDGVDADRDGLTDCEDPDCVEACAPEVELDCFDGEDEDLDGLTDCEDPDCQVDCAPKSESDCFDGVDEDLDELTDCEDPDCLEACAPETETDCTGGVDEDLDGLVDCADPDCHEECGPQEDCDDGKDNDADGLVDCEDADCIDVCGEICGNSLDDEGDGYADCDDDECWGDRACMDRTVQIIDGSYSYQRSASSTYVYSSPSSATTYYLIPRRQQRTSSALFTNLVGRVRFTRPDAVTSSCQWTVASLSMFRSYDAALSSPAIAWTRGGFAVDSACPITSADLPSSLVFFYGFVYPPGFLGNPSAVWYGRASTYSRTMNLSSTRVDSEGLLYQQRFSSGQAVTLSGAELPF